MNYRRNLLVGGAVGGAIAIILLMIWLSGRANEGGPIYDYALYLAPITIIPPTVVTLFTWGVVLKFLDDRCSATSSWWLLRVTPRTEFCPLSLAWFAGIVFIAWVLLGMWIAYRIKAHQCTTKHTQGNRQSDQDRTG